MEELLARPMMFVEVGESLKFALMLLALGTTRLFVLALIFPPMAEQMLQGAVRNGVCLAVGAFIAWGQPLHVVEGLDTAQLTTLLLKEAMLGLVLGFAASVVFWVAEAVGALIDNQAGFNNVQQSNPVSGQESTPLGNILGNLAQGSFWMLGGFTVLVGVLFETYRWWPMDRMAPELAGALPAFTQEQLVRLMRSTVTLAAPVMLVLLLIDLGFGLIGKTAEKLEPNSLAQPVKGAVAMLMVSLLVALYFQQAQPMLSLHHLHGELSAWLRAALGK